MPSWYWQEIRKQQTLTQKKKQQDQKLRNRATWGHLSGGKSVKANGGKGQRAESAVDSNASPKYCVQAKFYKRALSARKKNPPKDW